MVFTKSVGHQKSGSQGRRVHNTGHYCSQEESTKLLTTPFWSHYVGGSVFIQLSSPFGYHCLLWLDCRWQHRHYMTCVLLFSWVSFALPVSCATYQEWSCTHLKQQTCWFPIADLLLLANRRWVSSGALVLRPWPKCGLLACTAPCLVSMGKVSMAISCLMNFKGP